MRRLLRFLVPRSRKPAVVLPDVSRPPSFNEEAGYRAFLASVLDGQSDAVMRKLHAAMDRLPREARELQVVVFFGQEEDGCFRVFLRVDGTDLHVLNTAIKEYATLFEGRAFTTADAVGNVPQFDPIGVPFDLSVAITEECFDWMERVWGRMSVPDGSLPISLVSDDGYGGLVLFPRKLTRSEAAHAD